MNTEALKNTQLLYKTWNDKNEFDMLMNNLNSKVLTQDITDKTTNFNSNFTTRNNFFKSTNKWDINANVNNDYEYRNDYNSKYENYNGNLSNYDNYGFQNSNYLKGSVYDKFIKSKNEFNREMNDERQNRFHHNKANSNRTSKYITY